METRRLDLFHLTNLEVFKNLRQGLFSAELPAQLTDLIITIHEVTATGSPMHNYALELLTIADIQLSEIKSRMMHPPLAQTQITLRPPVPCHKGRRLHHGR